MGLKSIFDLKCYLNFGVKCSGIISISVIIASCISDGPNHTGGELLTGNGILLDNPYYHVKLPVFPVDSIWTQDEEPSHLGESVLMAGISGPFKAQVRLAFDIADTTLLDSLNDSLSSALRLSVCATQNTSLGRLALFQSVGDSLSKPDTGKADTTSFKDSLAFEVKTWAIPDRDSAGLAIMTSPQRTDTLNLYNHRFLGRMDPDSLLPLHTVLDTIQLKIRSAYNLDQFQNKNIPHLLKFLKANSLSTKWLIQMQLTPIVDSVNSQLAMLRLNGTATSIYGPGLIFGSSSEPKSATKKQKVSPLTFSNSFGVNYTLEYSGSKLAMIPSKARGLHLILNRARLLDSVNAALIRMHINPPVANKSGLFDLTYFVPFAEISLPLDSTTTLEGGYPLDLKVQSDLDSILPDVPVGTFTVKTTKIGGKTLLFYTMENEASDKIRDTVFALYRDDYSKK